jgi:hypothetical protein
LNLSSIKLRRDSAHSERTPDRGVGTEPAVSRATVRWMLSMFGVMYTFYILTMFVPFYRAAATVEPRSELIGFLVQCLLPLVALAVGYTVGHRNRQPPPARPRT